MSKRDAKNVKERLVKWFNDSPVISALLTKYRGAQRLRVCESCGIMKKNIHWAMKHKDVQQKKVYTHLWLCDICFYGPLFGLKQSTQIFYSPELTTESWLYPKDERRK